MRNCAELTKLLSDGIERPLNLHERTEIFIHTCICRPCRQFKHNSKVLHELMQLHRNHQDHNNKKYSTHR